MLPEDPTHHPLGFGTRATERVVERPSEPGAGTAAARPQSHTWSNAFVRNLRFVERLLFFSLVRLAPSSS
jgi:hypothetical protein